MKQLLKVTLFLAFSLSTLATQNLFAQTKSQPVQRWEYQSISCHDTELNRLGDEGWELVSTRTDTGNCYQYLLKRPKPANAPKYVDPYAQPKPTTTAPACQLTLAQAPKFRGIQLGMSLQELLTLFPGSEENPNVKLRLAQAKKLDDRPGIAFFGFDSKQYQNMKETKELFADIAGYHFRIFDDRMVSFTVYFPEYRTDFNWQWTISAWEKKLSETFNLPVSKDWGDSNRNSNGSSALQCNGFSITAQADGRTSQFTVQETIVPTVEEQAQERKQKAMEKIRQEFKINP